MILASKPPFQPPDFKWGCFYLFVGLNSEQAMRKSDYNGFDYSHAGKFIPKHFTYSVLNNKSLFIRRKQQYESQTPLRYPKCYQEIVSATGYQSCFKTKTDQLQISNTLLAGVCKLETRTAYSYPKNNVVAENTLCQFGSKSG